MHTGFLDLLLASRGQLIRRRRVIATRHGRSIKLSDLKRGMERMLAEGRAGRSNIDEPAAKQALRRAGRTMSGVDGASDFAHAAGPVSGRYQTGALPPVSGQNAVSHCAWARRRLLTTAPEHRGGRHGHGAAGLHGECRAAYQRRRRAESRHASGRIARHRGAASTMSR